MHASIRKYDGAPALAEELVKRQEELETALRPVNGFRFYYMIKTGDGAVSMTVCDDQAGAEESNRVAAAWFKDKLPTFANRTPQISTGEVRIHLMNEQPVKVTV